MVALHSSYYSLASHRGQYMPPEAVSQSTVHERAFALIRSLSERDAITYEHSRRVATYAYKLARTLGMPKTEARHYLLLGLLHDIGKMWVGEILTRDGMLTDEEYARIKTHATIGERMIQVYDLPAFYAEGVRHHHEAYDGRGYPDGLSGDAIPFAARIITIVDAFDVITSDRPYKMAATAAEAIAEITHHAGQQFDPALVAALANRLEQDPRFVIPQRICPVRWARRDNTWFQITPPVDHP